MSAPSYGSRRFRVGGYADAVAASAPAMRLQWVKAGVNGNVSGYCESGELFAFLASSPSPRETPLSTLLLRMVAGETEHEKKVLRETTEKSAFQHMAPPLEDPEQPSHLPMSSFETAVLNRSSPGGLFVSGKPISQDIIDTRFSYLESKQAAHLYQSLTVLETISFSAELRLSTHSQPVELSVLRLLTEMGFKDWAELYVSQLSEWQRRMLLFATEAIAGKDALFFDMPTSDLDAPSALAMVTSLQRAARGGRLVAISLNALTFREYAMLDNIQIISSLGSVYFGPGASAANYFRQLGRTPSPGASITDFLVDLVDDDMWPGGYADAHLTYLEEVAERLSLEQVMSSERKSIAVEIETANKSSRMSSSSSASSRRSSALQEEEQGGADQTARESAGLNIPVRTPRAWDIMEEAQKLNRAAEARHTATASYGAVASTSAEIEEGEASAGSPQTPSKFVSGAIASAGSRISESAVYVYNNYVSPNATAAAKGVDSLLRGRESDPAAVPAAVPSQSTQEGQSLHSLGAVLDSITDWTRDNGEFLEEEVDECWPRIFRASLLAPQTLIQFSQCFWRAVVIRRRNLRQIMATWVFTGLQVIIGLGILFCASGSSNSETNLRARVTFLAALPFSLVLLANNWNEYSEKDRNVSLYESKRHYYNHPVVSPLASLAADMIAFHLVPPVAAAAVLYPIVGLTADWARFFVYLRAVLTMSIAACCLNKAIAGTLAMGTRGDVQDDIRPKCNLVTSFVFVILFLYCGLLLDVGESVGPLHVLLRSFSFFYYGCNILFWNEFGVRRNDAEASKSTENLKSFLEVFNIPEENEDWAWLVLFCNIVLLIVCVGFTSTARINKAKKIAALQPRHL